MSRWVVEQEEASIVLVGNFNPKIFHPEWFIRHELIEKWDYLSSEVINIPDLSRVELPSECLLEVLENRLIYRSTLKSNHLALKDLVTGTFSILSHTPVQQIGLNYSQTLKIPDKSDWLKFGLELAPTELWKKAAPYLDDFGDDEKSKIGLNSLKMELPRPDTHSGVVRAGITAKSIGTILFSINSHIDLQDGTASEMVSVVEDAWEDSLELSEVIINTIMKSHLED